MARPCLQLLTMLLLLGFLSSSSVLSPCSTSSTAMLESVLFLYCALTGWERMRGEVASEAPSQLAKMRAVSESAAGNRDQQRRPEKSFSLILRMKSKKVWDRNRHLDFAKFHMSSEHYMCLCDNDRAGRHVAMTDDTLLGMEIWRIWRCWNKFSVCESDVCCCLVLGNFDID